MKVILCLVCVTVWLAGASMPIRWVNGQWDAEGVPRGKLLTDNRGYWGPSIFSGVTYSYEKPADNPPDRFRGEKGTFGRRLLDGEIGGNWHVPVGKNRSALVVVFDFKRPCSFYELVLFATRSPRNKVSVQVAQESQPSVWIPVHESAPDQVADFSFRRIKLPEGTAGRFLKVSFKSRTNISWLDEVLVWGDGEISTRYPERIRPLPVPPCPAGSYQAFPGIRASRVTRAEFLAWRQKHISTPASRVLWSVRPDSQVRDPVLPGSGTLGKPCSLLLTRNETETLYMALTNPSPDNEVCCSLSTDVSHPALGLELFVGGVVPVQRPQRKLSASEIRDLLITEALPPDAEPDSDMQVLPFMSGAAMPSRSMLKRYVANADSICEFPHKLRLKPGESALFMARFRTAGIPRGFYSATLKATVGPQTCAFPVSVQVLDITLPAPDAMISAGGSYTTQFPFESERRMRKDVRRVRDLGITGWRGFPEKGTKGDYFARTGPSYFCLRGLPGRLTHAGHARRMAVKDITADDLKDMRSHIEGLASQADALGLRPSQWFVELWDEPGMENAELYGAFARIIKGLKPDLAIFMNPCFWQGGFPPQQAIHDRLAPFYNTCIDFSCPIQNLVGDNLTTRNLWTAPRLKNYFYIHPARRGGRYMAWQAAACKMDGYAFYCYFAPRGNPWDIRTWSSLGYAYQLVFPLEEDVAITPIYETMREAWDDFRLLHYLNKPEFQALRSSVLESFKQDRQPDYKLYRTRILTALAP